MNLRLATLDDARLLWEWRNDPTVRAYSHNKQPIPWEDHMRWMGARSKDPDCRIWIAEVGGVPVGQVRYDREAGPGGKVGTISFSVAAEHRGKGYGTTILRASRDRAWQELELSAIVGEVKPENFPSRRAFEAAGFAWTEPPPGEDYRYTWPI